MPMEMSTFLRLPLTLNNPHTTHLHTKPSRISPTFLPALPSFNSSSPVPSPPASPTQSPKAPIATQATAKMSYQNNEDTLPLTFLPHPSTKNTLSLDSTLKWWKFTHFLGFFIGGTTFIYGTVLFYYPYVKDSALDSALFYTLGSLGFLYVDFLEYITFTSDPLLSKNISISMLGSTLYIIGSIGFIPDVYTITPYIGIWGFILGSFFIFISQVWKIIRIGGGGAKPWSLSGFRLKSLFENIDNFTQLGVEGGACLGAFGFFYGTINYLANLELMANFSEILVQWVVGSVLFTVGSLFLGFRHFVMGV